ncbi:tetratricopeptide repeat protein [Candidatus Leptofilum sp.]|uniref:tetratricopeptide repeat protein n=1 Tax=Candidatus Leptofilum sp. TaxID=3241576 RepID=UPI003B58F481
MHNLVPQFILNQLNTANQRGSFTAVGLFVDVSGFTQLMETLMQHGQHGAEVMASVMLGIFEPLVKVVFEQGGFVGNFAGDAFTAYFPIETPEKEQQIAQQAITAAWQAQQHLLQNPTSHTPYGDFQMSAKFGLALGEAQWGILSDEAQERATFYFRGTAVDGCALAEKQCTPGDVVLDAALAATLAEAVSLLPRNDFFVLNGRPQTITPAQPIPKIQLDMPLMSRFFPPDLITQPLQGEFRQIVNVFISLPAVENEAEIAPFMQTVFALQAQFGSVTSRLDFGDKGCTLLLFWGAPIAHETDIERALSFVMALREQSDLPIRAGVTYRVAHAGFIGSPLHEEFTCYGSGVNLAARFMMKAPVGEIWLDTAVFNRAQHQFNLQFVDNLPFKGFAGEQAVYRLVGRQRGMAPIFSGQMLGRERELAQLQEFIRPLADGRFAGGLRVEGDAGIGKSRLLHTFFDTLLETFGSHQIFLCQTDQILRQSLNPMRYWLNRYFNQSTQQSDAENKENFDQKLLEIIALTEAENLANELARTRSFLGALVDLHWPDSLYEQLEPQGRFENTLIGLSTLLRAESLQKPTLLVVEDVHWLDDDTRHFLQQLWQTVTAVPDLHYPLAILATSRPEQHEEAETSNFQWQTLPLGQLTPEEVNQLAASLLGGAASPALQTVLVNRGEGNPFFTEQIVCYLQEQNLLEETEEGWAVTAVQETVLPQDVHALLVARLDRLTAKVKNGVQHAAILGREFEVRLLAHMLQDDANFDTILSEAEQAIIWAAISELRYLFRHALVRDAAYKMQLRARRQSLHQLAVAALETLYAQDLTPHFGELAYHAEQADLAEKARDYLHKAGDVAREAYQNNEALDYYGRSLSLTTNIDFETRFALRLAREDVYHLLGQREAQQSEIEKLATLAAALNNTPKQAEVYLRQGRFAHVIGEHSETVTASRAAIELAQKVDDFQRCADGHTNWCRAFLWQGKYNEAKNHAKKALSYLKQTDDPKGEEIILIYLGRIGMQQGDYINAENYYQTGLRIAQEDGNREFKASVLNNIGLLFSHQQKYIAAKGNFERALKLYQEIGSREGEGTALNNLGIIAYVLGLYEEAYLHYEQSLFISREVGVQQDEAIALNNLGEVLTKQQKHDEAQIYFNQALQIERETGARYLEAHTVTMLGFTLLELGLATKAEIAFLKALSLRTDLGQPHLTTLPQVGLACVSYAMGNRESISAKLNTILEHLNTTNLDGLEDPFNTFWICYRLLAYLEDERATSLLQKAHSLLLEQGAKIPDQISRHSFLYNVPEHRLISETAARLSNQSIRQLDK